MVSNWKDADSVYDFEVKDLDGKTVSLSEYKGKVLLIVNVASKCGFAKHNFSDLNELHEKYYDKGLQILCFPCNQFIQETRTDEELKQFVEENGIKWKMFAKCNVNGENSIPLYKWLKHKTEPTSFLPTTIKYNFTKFLVDKYGQPVSRYAPTTAPMSFKSDIERELEK